MVVTAAPAPSRQNRYVGLPPLERLVFKILEAKFLAPGIKRFVLEAPRIARKQQPGQFVILRIY